MRPTAFLLALLTALCLFATPTSAEAFDQVTIGFLPPTTPRESVIIRGTAPRGQTVAIRVNGEVVARVIAGPSMDVYRHEVPLAAGENAIIAEVEGTALRTEAAIFRKTVSFRDLADHWAQDDAEMLATAGVVNGVGNGLFGPDQNLTRAQFAKIVVLGLGLEPEASPTLAFLDADDVPDWAVGYVAVAVKEKLITGFDDGTFRPDDPVLRVQVAVIAARGLRYKGIVPSGSARRFTDADAVPAWAAGDVDLVGRAQLLGDFWGTAFRPTAYATRAEAAAVVRRLRWAAK